VTGLTGVSHTPSRVPRWRGYHQLPRGGSTHSPCLLLSRPLSCLLFRQQLCLRRHVHRARGIRRRQLLGGAPQAVARLPCCATP
jgi:hypothetical protein